MCTLGLIDDGNRFFRYSCPSSSTMIEHFGGTVASVRSWTASGQRACQTPLTVPAANRTAHPRLPVTVREKKKRRIFFCTYYDKNPEMVLLSDTLNEAKVAFMNSVTP